jgi:RNA polymerase sigma-70 factor (ECF subfamily)
VILEMNRTKLTDTELVSSYRRGNEASFAELVSKYQSKVYTTIFLIVKDRYLAEDLTQDVFIKAINKIMADKYNEEGKFGPWIGRIAHNIAIDFFRKSKRSKEIVTEDGSPLFSNMDFIEDSFEDIQIKMETNAKVRVLIETLPENQKEVLVMRHYADMSFHEIAEQTGVSINTALGRMRYALINLRKKFEETEKAYDNKPYPN